MRRITTFILIVLLSLPMSLMAESREFTGGQVEQLTQQVEVTKERLNLTKVQEEIVKPILKAGAEKRCEVFKSYGFEAGKDKPELSFSEKRALIKELRVIRSNVEDQLEKELSDDQMKEYKVIQKERRSKLRDQIKNKS